ncbi:hypothetical protein [Polyangium mundeleinium]|uniref:Yip1 domain-containing protein n=1 Tax=Polyangium mundeleinium TaxID=2995306 RepID=A0ABT5EJP3_9BACT|nr:hypothetical protein [Polyangium mundeleinium]MDC0742040.1 hypothetical protein [Polyangium mundeleinium]
MDDQLDLGQAYAPSVASPPAAPLPSVVAPYERVVMFSFPVGVVVGLVAGSVEYLWFAYTLGFFEPDELLPYFTGIAVLRVIGPSSAMIAASITAVLVLHRAGRRASGPLEVDHARVLLVLAALPHLTVVTMPFCVLGALLVWLARTAGAATVFLRAMLDVGVIWSDFAFGLAFTALGGLWVTGLVRIGAKWLTTKKHGLALKLFVAYASLAISNAVLRAVLSVVDPA